MEKVVGKMEKSECPFEIRAYDKVELAMLYSPGRTPESASRTLRRWIKGCVGLTRDLEEVGYNVSRHRFLRKEVEIIVRHLGEP